MTSRKPFIKPGTQFCEAKTRSQMEAGSWADSQRGCGNVAKQQVDGHWVCGVHRDKHPYGWNSRRGNT